MVAFKLITTKSKLGACVPKLLSRFKSELSPLYAFAGDVAAQNTFKLHPVSVTQCYTAISDAFHKLQMQSISEPYPNSRHRQEALPAAKGKKPLAKNSGCHNCTEQR